MTVALFIACFLIYVFVCFFGYFFRRKPYKAYTVKNRILSCLGLFGIGIFLSLGLMSAVLNYYRSDMLFNLAFLVPSMIVSYLIATNTAFPLFYVKYGTKNSNGVDFFMQFIFLISVIIFIVFVTTVIITGSLATKLFL